MKSDDISEGICSMEAIYMNESTETTKFSIQNNYWKLMESSGGQFRGQFRGQLSEQFISYFFVLLLL